MGEPTSKGWWSRKLWLLVLFPAAAALLLAVVGVFEGWLHRLVGWDKSGRTIAEVKDKDASKKDPPLEQPRPTVSTHDAYERMLADLQRRSAEDRPRIRYLTLLHRHNDPSCTQTELEAWRHAVDDLVALIAKASPSHSGWFDPDQLLYRLDLGDLDWDHLTDWRKLVGHYRYGLRPLDGDEKAAHQRGVEELTADRIPVVRADWFVVALSRPPLAGADGLLRKPASDVPESVRSLARGYGAQALDLAACARELGLENSATLADLIGQQENLRQQFELAPLVKGQTIRRDWWESDTRLRSPYQEVARLLKLGMPVNVQ
jgi:hypothetical protein